MAEQEYSININHLSVWEKTMYPDTFDEYKKAVVVLLSLKNTYYFEQDIIDEFKNDPLIKSFVKDGKSVLEAVLETTPLFVSAGRRPNKKAGNKLQQAWFNLSQQGLVLAPGDFLFDVFFAYKLRQTDIFKIDRLLDYFLQKYYEGNKSEFSRFLKLVLRKHGKKLMQAEQIETVNEWIEAKEKEESLSGTESLKTKGKRKRERDDNLTKLNQEQTALLIYCLKNAKLILKDEYLNSKETGQAFSMLIGYSADTLRQNLSRSEIIRIASPKNIEAVSKALKDIQRFIEAGLKPTK